jgi:hypothetical protein
MIRDENGQLAGYVYVDTATTEDLEPLADSHVKLVLTRPEQASERTCRGTDR